MLYDTIAAISTPLGEGGIGIVRVSGSEAERIMRKIFRPYRHDESEMASHKLYLGQIRQPTDGKVVDEVLVSIMREPRSYTGEDMVEINCHGGIVPLKKVLDLVLDLGARLAEPGEFTRRAFLNGKIDLVQAEAIIDIIRAKTEAGLDVAVKQLEGRLSEKVEQVSSQILELLAYLEAEIDFPDEDIQRLSPGQIEEKIIRSLHILDELVESSKKGKIYREGIKSVIIGKPNVGKSSLLNALLREKRAIVTEIPGTTRDIIEEVINIGGIPLTIVDTAGIRETHDLVEKIGVEKSREFMRKADLILFVLDAATGFTVEDKELLRMVADSEKDAIVLVNKIDLGHEKLDLEEVKRLSGTKPVLAISATEEIGLAELENTILDMVLRGKVTPDTEAFVSRVRHQEILQRVRKSLQEVLDSLEMGMSADFLTIDLKNAWQALGELTGQTVADDVLDKIFEEFCIGK